MGIWVSPQQRRLRGPSARWTHCCAWSRGVPNVSLCLGRADEKLGPNQNSLKFTPWASRSLCRIKTRCQRRIKWQQKANGKKLDLKEKLGKGKNNKVKVESKVRKKIRKWENNIWGKNKTPNQNKPKCQGGGNKLALVKLPEVTEKQLIEAEGLINWS